MCIYSWWRGIVNLMIQQSWPRITAIRIFYLGWKISSTGLSRRIFHSIIILKIRCVHIFVSMYASEVSDECTKWDSQNNNIILRHKSYRRQLKDLNSGSNKWDRKAHMTPSIHMQMNTENKNQSQLKMFSFFQIQRKFVSKRKKKILLGSKCLKLLCSISRLSCRTIQRSFFIHKKNVLWEFHPVFCWCPN